MAGMSIGTVLGLIVRGCRADMPEHWAVRAKILEQAVTYTRAIVLGAPGMLMVYAANGIFRVAEGSYPLMIARWAARWCSRCLMCCSLLCWWGIAGSGVAALVTPVVHGAVSGDSTCSVVPGGWCSLRRLAHVLRQPGRRTAIVHSHIGDSMETYGDYGRLCRAWVLQLLAGFQAVNSSWNLR